MERLRSLRTVVWIIAAILLLELVMLVLILWPGSFFLWTSLGILALLGLYLVRISQSLLSELMEKEKDNK